MGVLPPQECFQPAIEAATKALEIDENLSEAHASLGVSVHAGNYDGAKAEYHLKRAIELSPAHANAYVWYAIVLFTEGRFNEGLEFARRSVDLDPLTPFNHHNIGWGLYYARRFEEAAAQYRSFIADFPEYGFGYYGLSKIHRFVGKVTDALAENEKAMAVMDDAIFTQLSQAECLAAIGKTNEALEYIGRLEEMARDRYVSPYQLSLAYCYLSKNASDDSSRAGYAERAIELLQQAHSIREAWLNWMGVEPVLDVIREDNINAGRLQAQSHKADASEELGCGEGA